MNFLALLLGLAIGCIGAAPLSLVGCWIISRVAGLSGLCQPPVNGALWTSCSNVHAPQLRCIDPLVETTPYLGQGTIGRIGAYGAPRGALEFSG